MQTNCSFSLLQSNIRFVIFLKINFYKFPYSYAMPMFIISVTFIMFTMLCIITSSRSFYACIAIITLSQHIVSVMITFLSIWLLQLLTTLANDMCFIIFMIMCTCYRTCVVHIIQISSDWNPYFFVWILHFVIICRA